MAPTRFPAAAKLAAVLLVVAGCAAALQASRKNPGSMANGEFKPSLPPVMSYGPDKTLPCPEYGANGALQFELDEKAKSTGKPAATQDGRLCAIADTMLGWKSENNKELPPENVRAFIAQYFGLPTTVRSLLINDLESEDRKVIASALIDPVVGFTATATHPIWGLMTERVKKNLTHVVLVLYDDSVQLDPPLPRRLAAGQTATLNGQLLGDFTKPRLEVVDPIGQFIKPPEQPGKAFKAELTCADHPGKILVQLVAEKEGSDMLITNFPVFCAVEPPLAAKLPSASKGPVDTVAAEKQLLDLVNSDRTTAGVKPLRPLPALSDIARSVAQKRAEGKGVSSFELTQKLKEAEIAAPIVLESMAQAFSIDDVYARFSDSPSDRSNTMNPDVTDVGVGVVKGPVIADRPTYIVAELFVKQRPPADPEAVKKKLNAAIDKKRAGARAAPLEHDKTLDDIAQKYAEAAVANGGRVPKEKESEILAPLYKESMTVNQLGGYVPDEASAVDVAEQPAIVANAKLIGVGVAVGNSPQFGKGSPFVMVLTGIRHAAPARKAVKGKRK
jgi:uncharacterized protein YkwD